MGIRNQEQESFERAEAHKRIYETDIKPLIDNKDYSKAFVLLTISPQLKNYLSHEELRTMYDFVEKELTRIFDKVSDISENKKRLEGKTKSLYQPKQEGVSI
jgi:hypothetical protein